jgi:hypothetical protein
MDALHTTTSIPRTPPLVFRELRNKRGKPPLTEVIRNFEYQIVEGSGQDGRPFRVRGLVQRSDVVNENNRIYPRRIWEKTTRSESPVMQKIRERGFFGELDHPDDGTTKLNRTSHIVTELSMNEQGQVFAEFEVLPTPAGRIAEALFRARTKVGASSRGSGDVLKESGHDVVQDDFVLEAFDFVFNPSTHGAYPETVLEHIRKIREEEGYMANSLEAFRLLENSAQDVLRINARTVSPEVRTFTENTVTDLIYKLGALGEESAEVKPLVAGLLSELQGYKQGLFKLRISEAGEGASNNMPPELLKRLGHPAFKDDPKAPDTVPPEPKKGAAAENEDIDSKEGKKMAEKQGGTGAEPTSKHLEAVLKIVDDGLKSAKAETIAEDNEKYAKKLVQKIERRLVRSAKGYMKNLKEEGNLDNFGDKKAEPFEDASDDDDEEDDTLEAAPPESKIPKPEDGTEEKDFMAGSGGGTPSFESIFREDEGAFEVPDPPEDLADDADAADADDEDLPPIEAKLVKTIRNLMRENKRLRYRRKVTEAVAAHALAVMTKAVRRSESFARRAGQRPTSFTIRGQRVPVSLAPAVIESLVRRYKSVKRRFAEGTEGTEGAGAGTGTDRVHGALPGVRPATPNALRTLHEGTEFGGGGPRRSGGSTIVEQQVALADAVFKRMSPKPALAAKAK